MWNSPEAAVMLSGGDPSILKKDELQDEVFKKRKRDCEMKDIVRRERLSYFTIFITSLIYIV